MFDQAYEWKSDEAINDMLQNMATESVRKVLELEIINCFLECTEITDSEIRRILYNTLNSRFLTDLANQINRELCWKGLALSKRIEIDHQSICIERIINETEEKAENADEPEVNLEGDFGFFHYHLLSTGGAVITNFKGGISEAVIPEKICDQPVIEIDGEAFAQCDDLVSVVLSSNVQKIGQRAFID
ncbi:MAG: hypothetical protein IJH36_11345 [Clostridia bacterium]|nr:hypothetical protein [Clostridia bacterium]